MSKADKELVMGADGVVTEQVPPAAPPVESFQVEEGDSTGYHFAVSIRGRKVFCSEMTKGQFAKYQKEAKQIAADMKEIQKLSLADGTDQDELADRSTANAERQAAQYAVIVADCVKGWEFPKSGGGNLPCNSETKAKLPLAIQCEIAMKVLQKSRMGQDESGF